jgi:hypothetical protein
MWESDVRLPKVHLEEPLKVQDAYFIRCITGEEDREIRSDGRFSLGVIRALQAVSESIAGRGTAVDLGRWISEVDSGGMVSI